jgi:nitrogen fixation protein FixH
MSAMHQIPSEGFRIRGWHVAVGVTLFFTIVIGVDVTFMALAYRTFPGQVSVTPYEDGLLYNKRIAQFAAQERLGWQAAAEAKGDVVAVRIEDRHGAPVRGLSITGKLERPATEAGRIAAKFVEAAPGRYEARVGGLAGAWDLSAEARASSGAVFMLERRLTWR